MNGFLKFVLLVLVTHSAFADILFRADTGVDCKRYDVDSMNGLYTQCQSIPRAGREVRFSPSLISTTEIAFVKSLKMQSILVLDFSCNSTMDLKASLVFHGQTQNIVTGNAGQKLSQFIDYNPSDTYELHMNEGGDLFHFVNAACQIEVVANVSLPQVAPLQWYASRLQFDAFQRLSMLKAIEEAQTLPAKYSVVQNIPNTLSTMAQSKSFERYLLFTEAQTLQALATRDSSQQARLEDLSGEGGLIESLDAELSVLENLKSDVQEGLLQTESCQDGPEFNETQCLSQVQALHGLILGALEDIRSEIKSLSDFLHAETERITGEFATVRQQIEALLMQINNGDSL